MCIRDSAKTVARSVRDRTRGDEFVVNEAAVKIDEIDVVGDNDIADVERAAAVKAERAVDGQYGITADNERIGIQIGIARNGEALNLAAAAERKVGVIAEDNICLLYTSVLLPETLKVELATATVPAPERWVENVPPVAPSMVRTELSPKPTVAVPPIPATLLIARLWFAAS